MILLTRTITRMPAFWGYPPPPPPPPHDYPYYRVILDPKSKEDKVKVGNLKNSPKFWIFEFWNKQHYTWHTFCLIRCANMKGIWWAFLKMTWFCPQMDRQTDRQGHLGKTSMRTSLHRNTTASGFPSQRASKSGTLEFCALLAWTSYYFFTVKSPVVWDATLLK